MKKFIKKLLIPLLALSITCTNNFVIPVQAATSTDMSSIETIAKNAPQFLLENAKKEWTDVAIVNEKPLYDFNDKLIAYSLDLKSKINNKKAYVIVSTNEEDGPIYEFATGKYSPYDKVTNTQTSIYDGATSYYSYEPAKGKYCDLTSGNQLEDTEITYHIANSKSKKYISKKPDAAKNGRLNLSQKINTTLINLKSTVTPATTLSSKILSLPDYLWYKGCSPTSAAMVLKYDFSSSLSSVDQRTLISKLATAMGTSSSGSTMNDCIHSGIISVMNSYGVSVNSYSGSANYAKIVTGIGNNRPFVLTLLGSTETAPSYPNGFGNHSMACVGYKNTTTNSYVVVHDTQCDGNVYCDYYSSALGSPYYTWVLF